MRVCVADVGEKVEDLGLDRDIERGDTLVEDDQFRFGGERASDGDALTLATGQARGAVRGVAGCRGRPSSRAPRSGVPDRPW